MANREHAQSVEKGIFGVVKFFAEDKGYGFIKRDDGKDDVFLHANDLKTSNAQPPANGDRLEFDVEKTAKGFRAVNIQTA